MISKDLCERLAAEVSETLSPEEEFRLHREIEGNSTAKQLLRDLQNDREMLQSLQRPRLGEDFATSVLAAINARQPIVAVAPRYAQPKRNRWLPLAFVAATVLGMICTSWLLREPGNPRTNRTRDPNLQVRVPEPQANPVEIPEEPVVPETVVATEKQPEPSPAEPKPGLQSPQQKTANPVLTAPPEPSLAAVEVARPRFSMPFSAKELAHEATKRELVNELARDSDHRLEIFAKDPVRAYGDIARFIRSRGITLVADPNALEAERRKLRTGFALYIEQFKSDDVISMLGALFPDANSENIVLAPIVDADRRELKIMLGVDPWASAVEPVKGSGGRQAFVGLFPILKLSNRPTELHKAFEQRSERSAGKLRLCLIVRPS